MPYLNFWKNSFKFNTSITTKTLLTQLAYHILVLVILYLLIVLFTPPTLENTLSALFNSFFIVSIIPTLAACVRWVKGRF